jgi:hypothetical protein
MEPGLLLMVVFDGGLENARLPLANRLSFP